jgi:GNAT superfamily N-acetyltransferase
MLDRLLVREATLSDLDRLIDFSLGMALETEGRHLDRERLRRGTRTVIEHPEHGFFMVADMPETTPGVVGQLLITFEWSDWRDARFWWIQSVYVDPLWRRKGVYRRMHETVVAEARRRADVCGIRLYVEDHNKTAQTVYQRVGLSASPYRVFEEDFFLPRR